MRRLALVGGALVLALSMASTAHAQEPGPSPAPSPSLAPLPSNDPAPADWSTEQLITAPSDQLEYKAYRALTGVVWIANKTTFNVAVHFDSYRVTLASLITNTLEVLAGALLPLVLPVCIVGAFLALVLYSLSPLLRVALASVRRALGTALFVPIIFSVLGVVYTGLETARLEGSRAIGASVYEEAAAH